MCSKFQCFLYVNPSESIVHTLSSYNMEIGVFIPIGTAFLHVNNTYTLHENHHEGSLADTARLECTEIASQVDFKALSGEVH